MSNYFENNINDGEKVIIEIKHSFLAVVPAVIKLVFWVAAAIVLNLIADKLVKLISDSFTSTSDYDSMPSFLVWLIKALPTIKTIVIIIVFIIFGIIMPVSYVIRIYSTKLAITNRRIIGKSGVFSTAALDYPIEKIDNVAVSASFFGKIFHFSNIVIKSTNDDVGILFEGVTNANEFRNTLTDAIAKNADEARKAQAAEIAKAMSAPESARTDDGQG